MCVPGRTGEMEMRDVRLTAKDWGIVLDAMVVAECERPKDRIDFSRVRRMIALRLADHGED